MLINKLLVLVSILMSSIFQVITIDYTEIKPGQYPYVMFFEAQAKLLQTEITGVGILVSDRTILTDGITGNEVRKRPSFAYSAYSGVTNATNLSLRYNIQQIIYGIWWPISRNANGYSYLSGAHIVVVILKNPVKFENGFHPIKIPTPESNPFTNEVDAIHVGLSVKTRVLYHSKISMKKWNVCIEKYSVFNNLSPENFFTNPLPRRNMLCSDLINLNDSIVQGPYIIKGATPKDDLLIGIHSFDFHLLNTSRISIAADAVELRHYVLINSNGTLI